MRNTICSLTLNPAIDKTIYVDDFKLNDVNRAEKSCTVAGSKGVNVARIIARCGLDSVCFGFIGGSGGEYVKSELEKAGVKNDFVKVDYDVRNNVKIVDLKSSTYTDVNFVGETPSEKQFQKLKEKTAVLARKSALIALGGSIPPGVDSAVYYELAQIAKNEGASVSVDCYGESLKKALRANPLVIKPNLFELETTYGEKYTTIDAVCDRAVKIYEGGCENVLVSLGGDGAIAVCGGDIFRLYTLKLPVYNTVGAGDAFLAGFIYGWHKGCDTITCLRHSLSFSQVVVSKHADEIHDLSSLTKYVSSAKVELLCEGAVKA